MGQRGAVWFRHTEGSEGIVKTKDEFELAYRRYCSKVGSGCDDWDIAWSYDDYAQHPRNYDYLFKEEEDTNG